jgi:hypothetical protein
VAFEFTPVEVQVRVLLRVEEGEGFALGEIGFEVGN